MLFTCEQVSGGHPDKICDQISDAIVTDCLKHDRNSRVAVECMIKGYEVNIAGEITSKHDPDCRALARHVLFNYCAYEDLPRYNITVNLTRQSPDIAQGVDGEGDKKLGAGDQGMMFGFACNETEELMPAPISFAHHLTKRLTDERKNGNLPWLRPDGKSQVSVEYNDDGSVKRIDNVVISTQHSDSIDICDLREQIVAKIIKPTLPEHLLDSETKFYVNPTGRFVIGGPVGDTGLTGRKIIVDTYGGYAAHGGGAFSGKDPTKVDRSAAYMARYVAKNIVAAGLAKKCQIQLAYAIGVAQPVSVLVDTYGTGTMPDARLSELVRECFDLRPASIIATLDLRRPIYRQTAAYGHFGRTDLNLPWEKTDAVERILARA